MIHRKCITHCSCAHALYPVEALQREKYNLTRFRIISDLNFFPESSAGH